MGKFRPSKKENEMLKSVVFVLTMYTFPSEGPTQTAIAAYEIESDCFAVSDMINKRIENDPDFAIVDCVAK
jgi:hypothetical protein